ncbi:unnamed protein product [Porites evermanni]|uniref:Uncharacterized protein n=1 Tax=Porites evermanni TaxID=104178 RepID=A0ABN8RCG7_9CNID|nr:unnamed protein product [Porites evermanni]
MWSICFASIPEDLQTTVSLVKSTLLTSKADGTVRSYLGGAAVTAVETKVWNKYLSHTDCCLDSPSTSCLTSAKLVHFQQIGNDLATLEIDKNSPSSATQHSSSDDRPQPKDYSDFPHLSDSILNDDEKLKSKNIW